MRMLDFIRGGRASNQAGQAGVASERVPCLATRATRVVVTLPAEPYLSLQAAQRQRRGHAERTKFQQTRPRAVAVETGSGGSAAASVDQGFNSVDEGPPGITSAGPKPLTELEGVVLDFSLGFTQKMLKVCAILDRNPARAAARLAEVRCIRCCI